MNHIVFTVTNDLNHDQRMHRICSSLHDAGFRVTLVGVNKKKILNLQKYQQKLITCIFKKGFLFYAEFNFRLLIFLLFFKADIFCCIDLDTILPVYFSGKWRNKRLVYDAHEYFSEQKEIMTRPMRYRIWKFIEKKYVPKFKHGYTVSDSIAKAFSNQYGVFYETIKNCTVLKVSNVLLHSHDEKENRYLIYQGAVNEARGLEYLIPAMKEIQAVLHIYGDGNMLHRIRALIQEYQLENKVVLKGTLMPEQLRDITSQYHLGINLVENIGLNQYYSLANKFFDYIHAEIPQLTMNFPEYKSINDSMEVAILIDHVDSTSIVHAINNLLANDSKIALLKAHCRKAKEIYQWKWEENKLITFYKKIVE